MSCDKHGVNFFESTQRLLPHISRSYKSDDLDEEFTPGGLTFKDYLELWKGMNEKFLSNVEISYPERMGVGHSLENGGYNRYLKGKGGSSQPYMMNDYDTNGWGHFTSIAGDCEYYVVHPYLDMSEYGLKNEVSPLFLRDFHQLLIGILNYFPKECGYSYAFPRALIEEIYEAPDFSNVIFFIDTTPGLEKTGKTTEKMVAAYTEAIIEFSKLTRAQVIDFHLYKDCKPGLKEYVIDFGLKPLVQQPDLSSLSEVFSSLEHYPLVKKERTLCEESPFGITTTFADQLKKLENLTGYPFFTIFTKECEDIPSEYNTVDVFVKNFIKSKKQGKCGENKRHKDEMM